MLYKISTPRTKMSLKYTSRLLLRAATIGGTAVLVGVSAFTGNDKHEKPKVLPGDIVAKIYKSKLDLIVFKFFQNASSNFS